MGGKVFAVQEVPHINYSDAERYGDIYFLARHEIRGSRGNGGLNREIQKGIQSTLIGSYNPLTDYILLCGDPIAIGVSIHTALTLAKEHGKIQVLKFDKTIGRYSDIEIEA